MPFLWPCTMCLINFLYENLRTDCIGRLTAVSGTVTRTSEVRPELLIASFRCNKCCLLAENIQQQYHYTRPTIVPKPAMPRTDLPVSSCWRFVPRSLSIGKSCVSKKTRTKSLQGPCPGPWTLLSATKWWNEPRLVTSASLRAVWW